MASIGLLSRLTSGTPKPAFQPKQASILTCRNEGRGDLRDHYDMPYVYWLPIQRPRPRWVQRYVQIGESIALRLAALAAEEEMTMQYDEPLFYSVEQDARITWYWQNLALHSRSSDEEAPGVGRARGGVGSEGIRRRASAVPTHCSHLIGECFGLPATAIEVHVQGGSLAYQFGIDCSRHLE